MNAVFDSSVCIRALRQHAEDLASARTWRSGVIFFSAVVGSEQLRGARDRFERRRVETLWKDAGNSNRLLVPTAATWRDAGVVLARLAKKCGYETIRQARLAHDALIGLSARQVGAAVVTFNVADYQRIAEFRPFRIMEP